MYIDAHGVATCIGMSHSVWGLHVFCYLMLCPLAAQAAICAYLRPLLSSPAVPEHWAESASMYRSCLLMQISQAKLPGSLSNLLVSWVQLSANLIVYQR